MFTTLVSGEQPTLERRAQGQARPARACRPGLAPRKVISYHSSGPPRFEKHVIRALSEQFD
ncbi:MAG TPA: hypothetical protein VN957_08240, partial [Chthoniobacterales bacterium]|nr:hypothetical protein [Chthoniobacterales bacterium]